MRAGGSIGWTDQPGIPSLAGTIGAFVRRPANGRRAVLSNNHVLAAGNQLRPGATIEQPSPVELGSSAVVGKLGPFVELLPAGPNDVDAACVLLDGDVEFDLAPLDARLGVLASPAALAPKLGDTVHKVGRTTGYTLGTIIAVDVAVKVDLRDVGLGANVPFQSQFLVEGVNEAFAALGDSGALVIQRAVQQGVGLVVASSDRSNVASGCRLSTALRALDLELVT